MFGLYDVSIYTKIKKFVLQTKGELSQERREAYEAAHSAFHKLHSNAIVLAVSIVNYCTCCVLLLSCLCGKHCSMEVPQGRVLFSGINKKDRFIVHNVLIYVSGRCWFDHLLTK